ncbi:MAG: response regulator, partial [Kiritimatiellota bacterium]|nr:response regulator [Kiritimatiellota bacterium]
MKNQEQKTILLVEDDTATMMVEEHMLKSFGYDVVTAKSGEEAVQIVAGNDKIALVLMDIELGSGMDGAEAAKQIFGKRHLPIVFLTVHTEKEYVERIKEVAGYGCVIKNSGDVVLQSSIEMAFNLFKSQDALKASEKKFREL